MAKEGESEFDDLELPGEEPSLESMPDLDEAMPDLDEALPDLGETDAAIADLSSGEPLDAEPAAEDNEQEVAAEEEPMEEKIGPRRAGVQQKLLDRLPANRELTIAVAVPVLLLLLWLVGLIYFSSVVYVIAVAAVPFAMWKYRDTSTIFTVLLGCALVAILTAVYCLWREWGTYGFDSKARAIRPTAMPPG